MEYTRDQLGDRFGVSGGSVVLSDSRFYWRLDAADYVETYGIGLPADFLEAGQLRRWKPVVLEASVAEEVEASLSTNSMPADLAISADPEKKA